MLSGIGPAEALDQFNIPVIMNLAGVGQNILDQPFFDTTYRSKIPTQSRLASNASFLAAAKADYLNQQLGPLTSSAGNYIGKSWPGFCNSQVTERTNPRIGWEKLPQKYRSQLSNSTQTALAAFPDDWPELQYVPIPAAVIATNDTDNYLSSSVTILATTSRGNLTIISTDATDNPAVNIGWLSTTSDQELAVAGFKRARQLANATHIVVGPEVFPGLSVQTDEEILQFIQSEVRPIHHAVSSCKSWPDLVLIKNDWPQRKSGY